MWNKWTKEEQLLQLASHLRDRVLQEWELLGEEDNSRAVSTLRTRLDRGSRNPAAQDVLQGEAESMADFICRLEHSLRVAYGWDDITLLYGQLH